MSIIELLLIAVSMSMDAFAVSICKGLSVRKVTPRQMLTVGAWFGGFQGVMPALGFMLTSLFAGLITSVSHWIAFVLLLFIGGNMIRESLDKEAEEVDDSFAFKTMLTLAVATSIDALAMGVTLNLQGANILIAAPLIALTTFVLSPIGLKVGNLFGARYKSKAEMAGGVVLVLLGIKILLEGLGVIC
ncbi:MAG: manganese efflux pump [Clostridia bacterium]|nr:manganese efflux pump [Clostridia bacterium]